MSKGSRAKKSMSSAQSAPSLSGVELVVLARLAHASPPSATEIERAVVELCEPEIAPSRAATASVATLASLRERRLLSGTRLTDSGAHALRSVFGLSRKPAWTAVRLRYLPMLAAGVEQRIPGPTKRRDRSDPSVLLILRTKFGIGEAPNVTAVCDALVANELGMPVGALTLDAIRAHVLARWGGVAAGGSPEAVAKRIVSESAGDAVLTLARQGLRRRVEPLEVQTGQIALPATSPRPAPEDNLLSAVREVLPKIGSEGRFGSEKVFVSALWHRIEPARRPGELSLDLFKRWLVTANRDGWLQLARADLVGAMDPKQVAESEIRDRGATFHFVLDRDISRTSQGTHA